MKTTSPNKARRSKNLRVPITFYSTFWESPVTCTRENKHTKGIMKKTVTTIALAITLPALTTLAQPGPGRGPRGGGPDGHRPPPPIVMALDANGDGVIDAQEIANAPAALAALDTNGDGKLTPDELRPPRPDGQGGNGSNRNGRRRGRGNQQQNGGSNEGSNGQHPVPPLIAVLDSNRDGVIDAQEIANASASLLTLDKNGDGQLSVEEFCPPPPGGGGSEQ